MKKWNDLIFMIVLMIISNSCEFEKITKKKSRDNQSSADERENREERIELEIAPLDGSNIQGHFQAKFETLNSSINGTIPGSANFFRNSERIYAYVRLFGGGPRTWHRQNVYVGNRCPKISDDLNRDGFIDILEAEKVLGKILIPLDSDIGNQESGRRFYPHADASGFYHYERITNFSRFLRDLQGEDKNPDDELAKLPPGKGLRLIGKAVMIQGISEDIDLPNTISSQGTFKPQQTLPVACGIFKKITNPSGSPYVQDEIPGPIAQVGDDQDRPATEELPGRSETGTRRNSESTNESDTGSGPMSDGRGRTISEGSENTNREDTTTSIPSEPDIIIPTDEFEENEVVREDGEVDETES